MLDTLRIENNGVPIYVQIRDQMLRAIATGELAPGAQLPTMRQVAVALRIDLNTVKHAYDELEKTGAISIVPSRGTFVAERSPLASPDSHMAEVDDLAQQTVAAARARALDPAAVARQILQIAKGGSDDAA